VSIRVVRGSNDFVIHDFVYLSPPVTSYPLLATAAAPPTSPHPLPVTRYSPRRLRRLLLPVDLRPDGEHHIAEHKGIQRDEGDVAAEVEGEHAADEEEEHAAGFFAFEVLPGEDRDPERHQERRRQHAEERPEIHHPLPFACEGRRLLPQADHPRRDRRPHSRFAQFLVPVELPPRDRVIDPNERLALLTTFPSS